MQEQITAQEIVNTVYFAMKAQGRQSTGNYRICKYRGEADTKCAVGCLILDSEYDSMMDEGGDEGSGVDDISAMGLLPNRLKPHVRLLMDLQECHDKARFDFWPQFKAAFAETCAGYNLTVPESE